MGTSESQVEEEFLAALLKGGELMSAGKMVDARPLLERAHELKPKNEKAQNLLGLAYFKLGLYPQASAVYEALVQDNPVDPTLRVNLGLVYLKANDLERCIKEFETATDLDPEHKKAHNYLGLALAQKGRYAQAKQHFVLAGSDAMADKMDKALAAAGPTGKPPAPASVQLAPPAAPPAVVTSPSAVAASPSSVAASPSAVAASPSSVAASPSAVASSPSAVAARAQPQAMAPPPPPPPSIPQPQPVVAAPAPRVDDAIEVMHAESNEPVEEVAGEAPAATLGGDWGDQLGTNGASAAPAESPPVEHVDPALSAEEPPPPITVRLGGDPEPPVIEATVETGEQLPVVEATVEEALDVTWTEPARTEPVAEPPSPDQAWAASSPTVVVDERLTLAAAQSAEQALASSDGFSSSSSQPGYATSSSSLLRQPTDAEEQDWGGVAEEVSVPVSAPVPEPIVSAAPPPVEPPAPESGTWEGEGVSSPSSVMQQEEAGWAGEGVPPAGGEEPWSEPASSAPVASSGSASWSDPEVQADPSASQGWSDEQAQASWSDPSAAAADGSGTWQEPAQEPLPGWVSQPADAEPATAEMPAAAVESSPGTYVARAEAQPSWEHEQDGRATAQWQPDPPPEPVPSAPGWVAQPLSEVSLSAAPPEVPTHTGSEPTASQETALDAPPVPAVSSSSVTLGAPAPAPLVSSGSSIAMPSPDGATPVGYAAMATQRLVELGASQAWEPQDDTGPFHQGKDGLAITVRGEVLSRLVGLVAIVGGLDAKPEAKKQRGRATDQPFGQGPSQLQRVTGHGVLYLEGGPGFQAIDLSDDEGTYLREERVFAFEEPLAYENGRLTAAGGLTLDLVNLKGQGRVLLSLDGALKVMPVPAGSPMVVPLARVVGWFGRVTPRLMGFAGQGAVELTGDGHVLLGAPS